MRVGMRGIRVRMRRMGVGIRGIIYYFLLFIYNFILKNKKKSYLKIINRLFIP